MAAKVEVSRDAGLRPIVAGDGFGGDGHVDRELGHAIVLDLGADRERAPVGVALE